MPDLERHTLRASTRSEPRLMAVALERWKQQSNIRDDTTLAAYLLLPRDALADLAVRRLPDPETPQFSSQVAQIAAALGCSEANLAALVREAAGGEFRRALWPAAPKHSAKGVCPILTSDS